MPKILVVDDELAILQFYGSVLESEGYEVLMASSFAQGRLLCAGGSPDVLIVDYYLKGGDGLDLVRESTSLPHPPATIVTSGALTPNIAKAARQHGAAILQKPGRANELLASVRRCLEN